MEVLALFQIKERMDWTWTMDIPDPVHDEGPDDDVDHAELVDDPVRVVEEGDGDHRPRRDRQPQQVDRSVQILLQ